MEAASGRLHKGGLAAEGGQPALVEIIMSNRMCIKACLYILRHINTPPSP